jgi:hypothetical protein
VRREGDAPADRDRLDVHHSRFLAPPGFGNPREACRPAVRPPLDREQASTTRLGEPLAQLVDLRYGPA